MIARGVGGPAISELERSLGLLEGSRASQWGVRAKQWGLRACQKVYGHTHGREFLLRLIVLTRNDVPHVIHHISSSFEYTEYGKLSSPLS